jgi:predicted murein hydrolase (TIGR00659 family)
MNSTDFGLLTPLFGFTLSLLVYLGARWLQQRSGWVLLHPLLLSSIFIICLLSASGLKYELYYRGASVWNWLTGPATVALAVPLYRQRQSLFLNWKAALCGVVNGFIIGVLLVWFLGRLFGLSDLITLSLLTKSVTIPIAVGITQAVGGVTPLTVFSALITGVFGAMIGPTVLDLFRVKHDVSRGIAFGATSHGAGTQQAFQENQTQGAMAGLSMGIVGFISAFITPVVVWVLF